MRKLVAAVLVFSTAGMTCAENWPAFRGANGSGVADGRAIPLKWDVEKGTNIRWKVPIPGFGHSAPIVWGERVYVTTAVSGDPKAGVDLQSQTLWMEDKGEFEWRVYALDKNTGKVLWERTAHKGIPRSKRHPQSSQASSTPATNGKVVVAYFGSEGLFAYDTSGKLLWKKDLGIINTSLHMDPDIVYGTASSPLLYRDLVIIQADKTSDSFIAAYKLKDGSEVWRVARDEFSSWSTPILVTGKRDELITQAYRFTRSYDPTTGRELWRFGKNGEQHIPSPVAAGGVIYFASQGSDASPVYAIRQGASGDISGEKEKAGSSAVAWYQPHGGVHIVSPLVYQGRMYICSDNGVISVFDAASGARIFRARLGSGGNYFASPIGNNGHVLFFSQEGEAFAVKAGPKFELAAQNSMGEMVMATPAVSDGILFVRGYKHLFAIAEAAAK
jgi:outer membrane protein assembly factor BamB